MSEDNTPQLTMGYLLGKIDQIASDTAYLHETVAALKDLKSDPAFADNQQGDNAGEAKAQALGSAIMCRETTNQQLIALYKQMYEDIQDPGRNKVSRLREIAEIYSHTNPEALDHVQETTEKFLGLSDA